MLALVGDATEAVSWGTNILGIIAIVTLILLNGYFVAAEFALVAIRKTRVEQLVAEGVRSAKAVELAVDNLDRSIAATQLGITVASIALGWVGEPLLARFLEPWLAWIPPDWAFFTVHGVATAIAFTLITFMHVIFGELMPKSVALQSTERVALLVSPLLNFFSLITRPIIATMNGTGVLLLRIMGYKAAPSEQTVHSIKELEMIIEDTEEAGLIDEDQADFVVNVFKLSTKRVAECMIAREKMTALEVRTPPDQILEVVRDSAHTRMPVYEGELDNIVGIVNTKDLMHVLSLRQIVIIEDALYSAIYLDPNEFVHTALKLFKSSRKHLALVRDEHEHIVGLLTLEDVLEEIVGDIEDEHDRPMPRLKRKRKPGPPTSGIDVGRK